MCFILLIFVRFPV
uniref:Uncharacterized protein n=1 Tax=Rhizophora mucronata TaxID=61149 RepID=A0A2P2LAB9_RHIMU